MTPTYPPARRSNQVDTYFGTAVPDPYRWLEDLDSRETAAWVEAQNRLTRSLLDAVPGRDQIRKRLLALTNFERFSAPVHRNGRYVYSHNSGLQNQAVLLWQQGLDGTPHLLLDPNTLSPDGTVALAGIALSDDGALLAYALAEAGSDWITWRVRRIGPATQDPAPATQDAAPARTANSASGNSSLAGNESTDLPDRILRSKFSSASWLPDNSGFVYSGYGLEASPPATSTTVIPTEAAGEAEGPASPTTTTTVIPTAAGVPGERTCSLGW